MPKDDAVFPVNSHILDRIKKNVSQKEILAELALPYIENDDIIFLDSSTTAFFLARKIQKLKLASLTIITNSVHIIQEFCLFPPQFVLLGLGGNYNSHLNSLLGRGAIEGLQRLQIGKAFLSAVGATKSGVTTYHEGHGDFLEKVLSLSKRKYLLLDGSKFNHIGLFKFAELCDFDTVFFDRKPPNNLSSTCREIVFGK